MKEREAILVLEDLRWHIQAELNSGENTFEKKPLFEAATLAIEALKSQQGNADKPLTIEELKEKRRKGEPVWIVAAGPYARRCGWGLAGMTRTIYQNFTRVPLWYEDYDHIWVAYDRPVEAK